MVHKRKHDCWRRGRRRRPSGGWMSEARVSHFKYFKGYAKIRTRRHDSYSASWKWKGMALQLQNTYKFYFRKHDIGHTVSMVHVTFIFVLHNDAIFPSSLCQLSKGNSLQTWLFLFAEIITLLFLAEIVILYYHCVMYTIAVGTNLNWHTSAIENWGQFTLSASIIQSFFDVSMFTKNSRIAEHHIG